MSDCHLFIHTKDILDAYKVERKKAIEYMAANRSRVAITTDLWTPTIKRKDTSQSQAISLMTLGNLGVLS